MMEGLAKGHICTRHGHRSSGDGRREGAEGRGAKWGEMGPSEIVSTIKIKKTKAVDKQLRGEQDWL